MRTTDGRFIPIILFIDIFCVYVGMNHTFTSSVNSLKFKQFTLPPLPPSKLLFRPFAIL